MITQKLTLCACQLKGKEFWGSAIEVKDEQLPLLIKTEYGREMAYNATTWTEKSNPSWQARFGLVSAAAMHDLYVIQGPNVTRDAREKIAFFSFHAFVLEDSRFQQNRVRTKPYKCGAALVKATLRLGLRAPFVARNDNNKTVRALWLVNQLWFIAPVNSWENHPSWEWLYKSSRPQVSMV